MHRDLKLKSKRFLIAAFFFQMFFSNVSATHIVGGEMYYRYLGNNNYRITLVVYRDCYTGQPPFDNPGSVGVFNANGTLVNNYVIPVQPDSITIPNIINSPCFIPPVDVCYRRAYYTFVANLPPVTGGYQLAYQRCCRNQSIINIVNPLDAGITIYANIPGPPYHMNSNPVYDSLPPPFLCLSAPFSFNHSATDPEGDSIVYELCTPFDGAEPFQCGINPQPCGPQPSPPFNPPYQNIQWQNPFGLGNLLGGVPLTINSTTGLLTATPSIIGQFVIGVCAKEFRSGNLISTTRRDYQLNVVPCPTLVVAALQTPLINCNSTTVSFLNQSIGAGSYFWNFGDPSTLADTSHAVNPSYTYPDTGVYQVTLIAYSNFNPGCADTTVGTVHLYPPFDADFTFSTSPCNLTVQFNSTSINNGSGFSNSWSWNFGDNTTSLQPNPSHTYSQPGTYLVTLIAHSDSGCVDTVKKTIQLVQTLGAGISIVQPELCYNFCQASATVVPTSGTPPFTYQWNDPANQSTQTATGLCAGTYTVTVTDSNGCSVVKTISISNPPPLTATVTSTDAYCNGLCIGTATAQVSGGTGQVSFQWNDPLGQQAQTATGLCQGDYSVLITDANGCSVTQNVTINFSNYIPPLNAVPPSSTIYQGQSVQISTTTYSNATYTWSPPDYLNNPSIGNPVATPPVNITYIVEFTDSNGCSNRDSVTILVKNVICVEPEIFIPNAFSPNNDGKNDLLIVRGATIRDLLLRIYDRWGEKVFETITPGSGWDGTFKGKPVLPGVYDYYLEATCYNNEKFFKKGNVTVIR